eukprot:TRINITY_DN86356_c0_g1_i1.p2 TRINITY_DN86356_c0_g1~~TRINITY_DN86356_c0_g1_i1.p2  ORF type:complete len:190 (-),score=35.61 TRINITY_DN86356_c0_g1_i1:119-688(-)
MEESRATADVLRDMLSCESDLRHRAEEWFEARMETCPCTMLLDLVGVVSNLGPCTERRLAHLILRLQLDPWSAKKTAFSGLSRAEQLSIFDHLVCGLLQHKAGESEEGEGFGEWALCLANAGVTMAQKGSWNSALGQLQSLCETPGLDSRAAAVINAVELAVAQSQRGRGRKDGKPGRFSKEQLLQATR